MNTAPPILAAVIAIAVVAANFLELTALADNDGGFGSGSRFGEVSRGRVKRMEDTDSRFGKSPSRAKRMEDTGNQQGKSSEPTGDSEWVEVSEQAARTWTFSDSTTTTATLVKYNDKQVVLKMGARTFRTMARASLSKADAEYVDGVAKQAVADAAAASRRAELERANSETCSACRGTGRGIVVRSGMGRHVKKCKVCMGYGYLNDNIRALRKSIAWEADLGDWVPPMDRK